MSKLDYYIVVGDENYQIQDGNKTVLKSFSEMTWKFWKITKEVPKMIPKNGFFCDEKNMKIICHPSNKDVIEESIEELI